MQRTVITIGVVLVSMLVLFSSKQSLAEEEGKPDAVAAPKAATKVTLTGEVVGKLDDQGNVVRVKFRSEEGKSYSVALTRNGKKLGSEMNGKKVEIVGKVIVKSANNRDYEWLRVKKFKEIEQEAASAPAAATAAEPAAEPASEPAPKAEPDKPANQ